MTETIRDVVIKVAVETSLMRSIEHFNALAEAGDRTAASLSKVHAKMKLLAETGGHQALQNGLPQPLTWQQQTAANMPRPGQSLPSQSAADAALTMGIASRATANMPIHSYPQARTFHDIYRGPLPPGASIPPQSAANSVATMGLASVAIMHSKNPREDFVAKTFNQQHPVPAGSAAIANAQQRHAALLQTINSSSQAIVRAIQAAGTGNLKPPGYTPSPAYQQVQQPPALPPGVVQGQAIMNTTKPTDDLASSVMVAAAGLYLMSKATNFVTQSMEQLQRYGVAQLMQDLNEVKRSQTEQIQKKSLIVEEHLERTRTMYDVLSGSRYRRQMPGRAATEASLRTMESNRDGLSDQQRGFFRERAEKHQALNEERQTLEEKLSFENEKRSRYRVTAKLLEDKRKQVFASRDTILAANAGKRKQIEENPDHTWPYRGYSDNKHSVYEKTQVADKAAKMQAAKQEEEIEAELTRVKQDELKSAQTMQQLNQQLHTVTKKQQQAAYEDVREETTGLRNSRIDLGSQSFGQMNRLKNIQSKAHKNEAIRKANIAAGRDENEGIAEMTTHEIEQSLSSGVGSREAKRQAERRAKKFGLERDDINEETLKEKQRYADDINKKTAKDEEMSGRGIENFERESESLAGQVVDKMKATFALRAFVAELERKLGDIEEEHQIKELGRSMIGAKFLGF